MSSSRKRARAAVPPEKFGLLAAALMTFWAAVVVYPFFSYLGRTLDVPTWEYYFSVLGSAAPLRADFLVHCLQTALIWLVFGVIGSALSRRLALTGASRTERALVAAGLGAGLVSSALFVLGLAGLWKAGAIRAAFYAAAAVCAALAARRAWKARADGAAAPRSAAPAPREPRRFLAVASLGLVAAAVVMNVLATTAPETFYDGLVYHLALPRLYLLRGGIGPTPENMYSGMPLGFEMLYGLALAVGDENLACLLHCSFGILTAAGIWAFMRRRASNAAGALAALIFYLSPVVLYAGWQSGVDLGTSFYAMLALVVLSEKLQVREDGSSAEPVAAGCLLGFAMAVKYTFVPVAALFAAVFFFLRRRVAEAAAPKETALLLASAAAVFSPWLIKNAAFYGNPFYPFLHQWIGRASPADWKSFLVDAHAQDARTTFGTLMGWKNFILRPWTITVGARVISDWPGLVPLVLTPCAANLRWGFFRKDDTVPAVWTTLGLLGLGGYLIAAAASDLVRFMIPTYPFLSCFAALALVRNARSEPFLRASWVLVLALSLFNMQETFEVGLNGGNLRWAQVRGDVSRRDYLESNQLDYHFSDYSAARFINDKLPSDANILLIGEPRGYYLERTFTASTVFDRNPFWEAARESKSADELLARTKALGATYLLVNGIGLNSYAARATVLPRDVVAGAVFRDFWNRCVEKVFEDERRSKENVVTTWLTVYRLRDKPVDDPRLFPANPALTILQSLRP